MLVHKNGFVYEKPSKGVKKVEKAVLAFSNIFIWSIAVIVPLMAIALIVLGAIWVEPKFVIVGIITILLSPIFFVLAYLGSNELKEIKEIDKELDILDKKMEDPDYDSLIEKKYGFDTGE